MFMFHRGPLQVVEGISRFAKLNRGALEQLKFVALWQKAWNMKTDLEGETPAGNREFRINTSNSLPERIGTTCPEPHRPSRRVIVESSAAGSMGVDGLWICWIRLAVLQFLVWFIGKWVQCLGGVSLLVCVRYPGGKVFGFSFAAVLKNSRRTVCFDKGVNTSDGNKNAT